MTNTTTKYTKFSTCVAAFITTIFTASISLADEGVVRAKVSLGYASYNSPYGSSEISTNYMTQGFGVTYITPSKLFVDLTTKSSDKAAVYNAKSVFGALVSSDQEFSRTENTLTIGMPTEKGLQINAGIFNADTTFNLAQYGQFSQKIMGLTAGVGKGVALDEGRSGSFGLSATVALLKASNTDRFGTEFNSNLAYGFSFGALYNYVLTQNLSIAADAKFQTYFIKYATFSGDERILSSSLSLIGQF